jgi:hypothetical protein
MRVSLTAVARLSITFSIKLGESIKRLVSLPWQVFARNGLAHIAQPNGPEISSLADGGQERRGDQILFLERDYQPLEIVSRRVYHRRRRKIPISHNYFVRSVALHFSHYANVEPCRIGCL